MPIQVWLPLLISFCMLLVSVLTFARSGTKERKEAMQNDVVKYEGLKESLIRLELIIDQINLNTSETRNDLKTMNNRVNAIDIELATVKGDIEKAYACIDELRTRIEKLEE